MEIIDRPTYTTAINKWLGKGLVIVLTGQRRIGKSMCLSLIARQQELNGNNVVLIDKEDHSFDKIKTSDDLNAYIESKFQNGKRNIILIDEVQEIVEFEHSVRSWIKKTDTDVIITGSNARMLSSDLSTKLSARYIEIPIHSLSYQEFLVFNSLEDSDSSLEKYLTFGGLPYLRIIGFDDKKLVSDYINSVYDTVVLKDIVKREQIRNVPFLLNLGKFVSDNIGKQLSPNSIMKFMKSQGETVSAPLILSYLTYFVDSYLAYRVYRYDIHGKSLLENNEKYYFEDLGIRNMLVHSTNAGDIEKRIENVVYMHLLRNGWNVYVGQLYNTEIDFVAEKENQVIYIQVTYLIMTEETEKREFGNLLAINNNHPKMLISMNPLNTDSNYQGIRHIHLREFLKQDW
ncbi:MAG: ATP-binding protein [Bacteroidales bacterium]|nr:ATP-binding protein [Bacteroidales bacterium]